MDWGGANGTHACSCQNGRQAGEITDSAVEDCD